MAHSELKMITAEIFSDPSIFELMHQEFKFPTLFQ